MVLAGFKPVAGCRKVAWVGSIPTRLRQLISSAQAHGQDEQLPNRYGILIDMRTIEEQEEALILEGLNSRSRPVTASKHPAESDDSLWPDQKLAEASSN